MKVLGIESSCDETAASIVELVVSESQQTVCHLVSNVIASSADLHVQYGGVVPEIAARSHIEAITPTINQAFTDANTDWSEIDAIAVTHGAGLGGSLLVGVMAARTLAITKKKPLYGINHVEAHVYANFLTESALPGYVMPATQPQFPVLALIVSGSHTQLALFEDHFTYKLLGQTRDDAIGEAFDKVARIAGLPYPGGPSIAKKAPEGDALKYQFPKSRLENPYDFSFSGIKTAVLRLAQKEIGQDFTFPSWQLPERLSDAQKADIVASFQRVAIETVVDKTLLAFDEYQPASVVIAGGVSASQELRRQLSERLPLPVQYTDIKLATDNGAMVATLGCFKHLYNQPQADPYSLGISPSLSM
jgi:N6-L-threonylcarbamoyladenine synthase